MASILYPDAKFMSNQDKLTIPTVLILGLLGVGLSAICAQFAVMGLWPLGVGLILALPGAILLHKYPLAGLMLWLLLTPFVVATNGGGARKVYWVVHRFLPVITLGVIVLMPMLKMHARKLPKLGWAELAMFGYLLCSVISVIYLNNDPLATAYHLYERVAMPMCLYLIVRLTAPTEQDLRRLLPIFIFILLSQSAIGILSWVAPQVLPDPWLNRVGLRTTGSLRAYSVFSTTVIFAGLYILHSGMMQERRWIRIGAVLLFFLMGFMVFLSYSRGSWLAGMVVFLGVIYLYPQILGRMVMMLVPLGLVIGLVGSMLASADMLNEHVEYASNRFYSDQSEESALSRLPVYYASYRMFMAKPAFGWGYGNFDRYDRQFQDRVLGLVSPEKDHASHNLYLTVLAEQGAVGFFLFMFPLWLWWKRTIIVLPDLPTDTFKGRQLVIVFWLVLVSHVIVNNFSNMRVVFGLGLWWLALGFIASIVDPYRPDPAESPVRQVARQLERRDTPDETVADVGIVHYQHRDVLND